MDGLPGRALGAACLLLLAAGWLGPEAWGSPTPPPSPAAPPPPPPPGAPGSSQDTCTSCGGFRRPEELGRVDGDFLEAVKRHILSRLQMRGRPNITHAVPKAAMVTALRKLHAGKVREDGRVEIPHLDGHASPGADGQERVSEIISFAETDGLASSRVRLYFFISNEGNQNLFVVQASLWLYLKLLPYVLEKGSRRKVRVKVYFQEQGHGDRWNVVEKKVDLKRSGWHTFPLTEAIQALFERGERRLNLDVQCDSCQELAVVPVFVDPGEESHRPFVVVQARLGDSRHRIRKRGLECDGRTNLCCRQQFFIDFRLIGRGTYLPRKPPREKMPAFNRWVPLAALLLAHWASVCLPVCVEVPSETEAVQGSPMKLRCISCMKREEVEATTVVEWFYRPEGGKDFLIYEYRNGHQEVESPFQGRLQWNGSKDLQDVSITVLNVTLNDSGLYTCNVSREFEFEAHRPFVKTTRLIPLRVTEEAGEDFTSVVSEIMMYILLVFLTLWLLIEMVYCYRKVSKAEEAAQESASDYLAIPSENKENSAVPVEE